ncbi:MAG: glycoside hydrolase family 9 protein [Oscillospiraceae bacterium]|nr:glycoside hydrolase family 9 protein [Oscillospiraceae bacterium]
MLKKTFGKRMASGVVTAAMLASATCAALPSLSLSASAGQMLGQTDFNDGIGLPWHTCETPPAKLNFNIKGGTYNIEIVNNGGTDVGGESRWDCQFRHRKLKFHSGDKYTVKAEVTSDTAGEIYTKIGNLKGDVEIWHNGYGKGDTAFDQNWNCMPVTAGSTLTIDSSFTCSTELEVGEWAWHFGGAGEHQNNDCFPEGTNLKFDNMSLTNDSRDTDDFPKAAEIPEYPIHGNQVGYYTKLAKKATLHDSSSTKVYLVDASSKKSVWEGTAKAMSGTDVDSGMKCAVIDFSDFTTPGTYYFSLDGSKQASYEFKIGDDVYGGIVADALNYFYQNRSGIEIQEKYITSTGENSSKSALAHKAGHTTDTAAIQTKWVKAYKADGSDIDKSAGNLTASGGWYDAGDHGKYVVNGGISVWTLQNLYEWTLDSRNNSDKDKFGDSSKSMVVPEAGNKYPDLLDEARVELEWFFKMMVDGSYKMSKYEGPKGGSDTGVYKNMVYHKLHDHKWTGLATKAWDYEDEWGTKRIVKPPSVCATLNVAACAAQAARLWKGIDDSFADECLENAKLTYEAAKANPKLYAPLDQAIGGGAYGDDHAEDDFYWAACELYITTGDTTYLKDLEGASEYAYKISTTLNGGENSGTFTSFNWGNTAALGTLSLYLNKDAAGSNYDSIVSSITKAADAFVAKEAEQGFGIPYAPATFQDAINIGEGIDVFGYEWGSNSMVANNNIVMAYAYSATGKADYLNGVVEGLDYLFGRNARDFSYVTGYGTYHCTNPHHRWWSHELDEEFPYAPAGVLSGGPNAGLQDPYVGGAGLTRGDNNPSQLCYVDSIEAWSVNEVTINWNSPFAWIMSFVEDEANADGIVPTPGSSTTTTTTTTTTSETPGQTDWGNVDCSSGSTPQDRVDISDVILLSRIVAEDTTASLTAQGKKNANVVNPSVDKLDGSDVTMIIKFIARLVDYDALGK